MPSLVNQNYQYVGDPNKVFRMIDNYIYLYHTDTLIALPTYPETIGDNLGLTYTPTTPLSRSAPIYSFTSAGPRAVSFSLTLHRDMMHEVNVAASNLDIAELGEDDYIDTLIKQLYAIALPNYTAASKMVNPPMIAVRFANDIFVKGVVMGGVNVEYSGPILRTNNYAIATVNFVVEEVDPYDAETALSVGGFRGVSTTLERRIWKSVK